MDNIFGYVAVTGRGSGQALLQMDYTYSVDQPDLVDFPPVPSFDLDILAKYSGRNSSIINFRACQRLVVGWLSNKVSYEI